LPGRVVDPLFHTPDVGLAAIRNMAPASRRVFRGGNEFIGALSGIDRLFRQNVQSTLRRGDALRCVQSGGTTDRDQIQPAMIQDASKSRRVGRVLLRKPGDFRLMLP